VVATLIAIVVMSLITMDMVVIILWGKGLILKLPRAPSQFVDNFVDTISKWSALCQATDNNARKDAERFVAQLPEVDLKRLEWIMNLMRTGLFGSTPSKRISGISPVAPRREDADSAEINRISTSNLQEVSVVQSRGAEPEGDNAQAPAAQQGDVWV
jgi:hypothetical protein